MSYIAQLTINGLIAGSIYALVAAGFSLIYNTNKFMHFAHSITVLVSAYTFFRFYEFSNSILLSIIPAIVFSAFFGVLIYQFIYYPLQKKNASNVVLLLASIATLIIFQNIIQALFGASVQSINYYPQTFSFLGISLTLVHILLIDFTILIGIFLYYLVHRTKIGTYMRAISNNKELASITGIEEKKVIQFSFLIGSLLGGIAGIFIILVQNISPIMGTTLIIKGFSASVIGGINSIPATLIGGILLGLAENYGIAFLPSGFKDAISFFLLFIFLLLKPEGLFGKKEGRV